MRKLVHNFANVRKEILRAQGCCVLCESTDRLEVDHIRAIGLGGPIFDRNNLQVLCKSCHTKKTKSDRLEMWDKKTRLIPILNKCKLCSTKLNLNKDLFFIVGYSKKPYCLRCVTLYKKNKPLLFDSLKFKELRA